MDLGLNGKNAIDCASSRGLGKACALSLALEGVDVVINGLHQDRLDAAQAEIEALGAGSVTAVLADINTEDGRAALVAACPGADILVNNNEGPPPGQFGKWQRADFQAAIDANFMAPVFMIQALLEGMKERRFGRIVNITSAKVKSPRSAMGLSREEAVAEIHESIAAKRMGTPSEFGDACAFLCSVQAGFISGQNLQLDGGSYSGLIQEQL